MNHVFMTKPPYPIQKYSFFFWKAISKLKTWSKIRVPYFCFSQYWEDDGICILKILKICDLQLSIKLGKNQKNTVIYWQTEKIGAVKCKFWAKAAKFVWNLIRSNTMNFNCFYGCKFTAKQLNNWILRRD